MSRERQVAEKMVLQYAVEYVNRVKAAEVLRFDAKHDEAADAEAVAEMARLVLFAWVASLQNHGG